MIERMEQEVEQLDTAMTILELVANNGPIGIVDISNESSETHSTVRYHLRVLEEESLIEQTSNGAVISEDGAQRVESLNDDIDAVLGTLETVRTHVETGMSTHESGSEGQSDTDLLSEGASVTEIEQRYGSVDTALAHENGRVRLLTLTSLSELAEENPGRVLELASVATVSERLTDERPAIREEADRILQRLVEAHPGRLTPALSTLFEQVSDDTLGETTSAVALFDSIAAADLSEAKTVVDTKLAPLTTPESDPDTRVEIMTAVQTIAGSDHGPEVLGPSIDLLADTLESNLRTGSTHEEIRWRAASTLGTLAGETETVADQIAELTDALDDDSPRVRRASLEALGGIETESLEIGVIKHVAEHDADEGVRRIASDLLESYRREGRGTDKSALASSNPQSTTSADSPSPTASVPDTVPDTSLTGLSTDDLDLREKIGYGGNADVLRADTGGESVAVKQPRIGETVPRDVIDTIIDEAKRWSRIDEHRHIVSVISYGEQSRPWIAMEFMDGGDLRGRIDEVGYLQAVWILQALSQAVAFAHRHGIAHLDLKPENILLAETDGDTWDVPKIADWGLSHTLAEQPHSVSDMSPQYAAPEQFDQDQYGEVGQKTDTYQLGLIAYELFVGTLPFGQQPARVIEGTLGERVPTPGDTNDSLPPELDDIVSNTLATRPDDRYEHVLYLRDDLESLWERTRETDPTGA